MLSLGAAWALTLGKGPLLITCCACTIWVCLGSACPSEHPALQMNIWDNLRTMQGCGFVLPCLVLEKLHGCVLALVGSPVQTCGVFGILELALTATCPLPKLGLEKHPATLSLSIFP